MNEYHIIYNLFYSKSKDEIITLLSIRENELSQRLYLTPQDVRNGFLKALEKNLNSKKWELQSLNGNDFQIVYYSNGHLATLVDKEGYSPIKFFDNENDLIANYEFLFYMDSSTRKLVIGR